ncbi:ester cyclase [Streptomyces sp. NPDC049040]|uniref:ester cyclase n=1 Tax=Streptomyces sp. NPDC049040 TaxID=3365593 RepID=UPI003717B95C
MSNDTVLGIAQQMGKVFNDLDEKVAYELVADDFVDHEAPPGTPGGPGGYLGTARWMNSVFTEAAWDHIDSFADGDKAVIRVRFTGIHTGDFLGFEGKGNKVDVEHIHIYRVGDDGLVHEHWACRQDLFLLAQIGAVQLRLPPAGSQA